MYRTYMLYLHNTNEKIKKDINEKIYHIIVLKDSAE